MSEEANRDIPGILESLPTDRQQPVSPALNPMPIAPPEPAATWLERMSKGALLGLVSLSLSICCSFILVLGVGPTYLLAIIYPVIILLIYIVGLWWLTSPEPGRPDWLIYLRWGARIGALVGIAGATIRLAVNLSILTAKDVVSVYVILQLVYFAGGVASQWYLARLSRRLGDRLLRISFGIFKWLGGVVLPLMVIFAIYDWQKYCERYVRNLEAPAQYWLTVSRTQSFIIGWIVYYGCIGLLSGYLEWRLWRRLRTAAGRLRGMSHPDGRNEL